jgi:hypothetical protein
MFGPITPKIQVAVSVYRLFCFITGGPALIVSVTKLLEDSAQYFDLELTQKVLCAARRPVSMPPQATIPLPYQVYLTESRHRHIHATCDRKAV